MYSPTPRPSRAALDRTLASLERRYDRQHLELREYNQAQCDINLLLKEKVIDQDHADILRTNAMIAMEEKKFKRKTKEKKQEAILAEKMLMAPYEGTKSWWERVFGK